LLFLLYKEFHRRRTPTVSIPVLPGWRIVMTCDRPSYRPRLRVGRGAVAAGSAILLLFLSPVFSVRVDEASATMRKALGAKPTPALSNAGSTRLARNSTDGGRISGQGEPRHRFSTVARDAYVAQFEPERNGDRRFDGPRQN
jgi:hypothetical protein